MQQPTNAPLNKRHLYEQVAELLETEIIAGHEDGERLPSEQALAERCGVSRTIIREAFKLLKARGLIDSRTGSGAYVTRPEAQTLSDVVTRIIRFDEIDIPAVYDVRGVLECAAVSRAVKCATEDQLCQMEALLARLKERTIPVETRRDLDFAFHHLIAEASGNPLLQLLVETMGNVIKDLITSGIFMEGGIDDAIVRHQLIMDALRARDAGAADRAMQAHLDQSLINALKYAAAQALIDGRRADGSPA
ncbi:MAG: FCD domain-containing protein [Clostridia bacterium]